MEIVFTSDIQPDDWVNYTTVQKIEEIETCAAALCGLPVDTDMLTPKAVRRVREQAYMFKITYNDGYRELVDAVGRFVVIAARSTDCLTGMTAALWYFSKLHWILWFKSVWSIR